MARQFSLIIVALALVGGLLTHHVWAAEAVCSRGDILLCEDWEWSTSQSFVATSTDWTSRGWILGESLPTYQNSNVFCNNLGHSSLCAFQLWLDVDGAGTQYPDKAISPINTGTVFMRFFVKYSPGYKFNYCGGSREQQKIAYFRALDGSTMAWRIEINNFGAPPDGSSANFGVDLDIHNNFLTSSAPMIAAGQWYAIELGVTMSTVGQSNGRIQLWVDDVLRIDAPNQDVRGTAGVGPFSTPINDAWLTSYYGGPTCPHPQQFIWYDKLVVSTNRIGMGSGAPVTPAPPTNLRISMAAVPWLVLLLGVAVLAGRHRRRGPR